MYSFKNISLSKPVAFFDLETTGLYPSESRIVEWSVLKIMPDGEPISVTKRCNPGIPIPDVASNIHGIFDHHVSDLESFAAHSEEIVSLLQGCYLSGFNILRFDIPFLNSELERVKYPLVRLSCGNALDVMKIFHSHCQRFRGGKRTLSAAYELYCGESHANAHGAAGDVLASAKVLDSMVVRHSLPR